MRSRTRSKCELNNALKSEKIQYKNKPLGGEEENLLLHVHIWHWTAFASINMHLYLRACHTLMHFYLPLLIVCPVNIGSEKRVHNQENGENAH